jgi:hypothetical protein
MGYFWAEFDISFDFCGTSGGGFFLGLFLGVFRGYFWVF